MANNLGDYDLSAVIYGKFTTFRPSTGATFTLGGTPALSVYKDNSTTQSTTGVTLTADFDSVTGFNHFAIDTSTDGTFYSAGSFFDIVITTGSVDSVSVTGSCVGQFTIRKTSTLKPTTAGRALDVSAGGEAGLDWANIGSPTTANVLSGTTVGTATTCTDLTANRAEPGQGAPAASTSVMAKVDYIYKNWRNRKTNTATVWSLYADDATTVDQKSTVADDGTTASKTEVASGP